MTDGQEIERLPEVVIAPEGFTNEPEPEQTKDKSLITAELISYDRDMFPWLVRVALPALNWL